MEKTKFFWGGSISSFQSEGTRTGDGKGTSVVDRRTVPAGLSDWSRGIDFLDRYEEDICLMEEMGMNCFRFQISWSRIIPDGDGVVNEQGLLYYDKLIDCLLEHGIEPMVCLIHFDIPYALVEKYNGFADRRAIYAFERYARTVMERYGKKVKYWLTFNEHNLNALHGRFTGTECGHLAGSRLQGFLYQVNHHTLLAHGLAVKAMRELVPGGQMSGMMTYKLFHPADTTSENRLLSQQLNDIYNNFYFDVFTYGRYPKYMETFLGNHGWMPHMESEDADILSYTVDNLAFSYYNSMMVKGGDLKSCTGVEALIDASVIKNPNLDRTEWGWEIDPAGLRIIMNDICRRYQKPVFILENGIGLKEQPERGVVLDYARISYHKEHICQMLQAMKEDGADCMGYLTWAPMDILSSHGEMEKRYGFIYVNRGETDLRDMKRIRKQSFYWMKDVIESNGESLKNGGKNHV